MYYAQLGWVNCSNTLAALMIPIEDHLCFHCGARILEL